MMHVTLNIINAVVVYFSDPSTFRISMVAISHPTLVTIKCSTPTTLDLQQQQQRLRLPQPVVTLIIKVIILYGNYTDYLN